MITPRSIAQRRRPGSFAARPARRTVMPMADGDSWSAYLRRQLDRPGWTIKRLAEESRIHRATISEWVNRGAGPIRIQSVYAVADALGADRTEALHAAGGVDPEQDHEIDLIRRSGRPDEVQDTMIRMLLERREAERQRRVSDLNWMLGRGETAG